MLKFDEQAKLQKDRHQLFNVVAIIRIIFLTVSLFNSTIDLGLSFSILKIGDTATAIVIDLLIATIINIILLIIYLNTVETKNNQSTFLIYIVEVLSSVYGILGLFGFIRYIQVTSAMSISAAIGIIGLLDLIVINIFIGTFFMQGKLNNRLIEIGIIANVFLLIALTFI